ncbi:gfo/Idh/MocA family oxidoreductase, partial [Kineococcus sp. LSe6-4]
MSARTETGTQTRTGTRIETRTGPVGIGIIGAGVISGTYLDNLTSFPDVHVHAIGDLVPAAA